jgi:hypothetical protein
VAASERYQINSIVSKEDLSKRGEKVIFGLKNVLAFELNWGCFDRDLLKEEDFLRFSGLSRDVSIRNYYYPRPW